MLLVITITDALVIMISFASLIVAVIAVTQKK
ncbi:putative holin-like toxin [Peribacillus cavernae]